MIKYFMTLVVALGMVYGISGLSHAGNPQNSGANASATAIITCFLVDGASVFLISEADIFVTSCGAVPSESVGCERSSGTPDACVQCLNNLAELGFSLLSTQCDFETGLAQNVEVCTHTLQGNAAPIKDRTGCD